MSALVRPLAPRSRLLPSLAVPATGPGERVSGQPVGGERLGGRGGHLRLVVCDPPARTAGPGAPREVPTTARRPARPRARSASTRPLSSQAPRRPAPGRPGSRPRPRVPEASCTRVPARPAALHPAPGRTSRQAGAAAQAGSASLSDLKALLRPALVTLGLVLAVAMLAASAFAVSGLSPAPTSRTRTTVVQADQSLWDVAAATGASDVAEAVVQITELNDLTSPTLRPGQTLLVPVR